MTDLLSLAGQQALVLAEGLTDPHQCRTAAPVGEDPCSTYAGHPGLALLFARLAHHDPQWLAAAEAHLAVAARSVTATPAIGVLTGPGAVLAAALGLIQITGDHDRYRRILATGVPWLIHHTRVLVDNPADWPRRFDTFLGLTGMIRILLAITEVSSDPRHRDASRAAAGIAVAALRTHVANPTKGGDTGMAHGLAGQITALAFAIQADLPGARATAVAAETACRWLSAQVTVRDGTMIIPCYAGDEDPRRQNAWCYGLPGAAVALNATALALGNADLARTAAVWLSAATTSLHQHPLTDPTVCHGWGGILQITSRIPDAAPPGLAEQAVRGVLEGAQNSLEHLEPGLLNGRGGMCAVLADAAFQPLSGPAWDMLLMLS